MGAIINLYSENKNEIKNFLNKFYSSEVKVQDDFKWEKIYENPVEASEIIGTFIDNNDSFKINMWISLDEGFFVNVTDYNADKIIRYLFERYPY